MFESNTILVCLVVASVLLGIGVWLERRKRIRFESNWPAMSDDEFLAACSPGTSRDTALRVRRIIAEQLGVSYERIHPDQHFVDDLDCC
jgi:hypothetical protein